ncbi:hypothetical protein CVS40_1001 [Lucilia cuprina]|nr:hypothetical protein CVS40_1001 [Lucilia cuprina]
MDAFCRFNHPLLSSPAPTQPQQSLTQSMASTTFTNNTTTTNSSNKQTQHSSTIAVFSQQCQYNNNIHCHCSCNNQVTQLSPHRLVCL